MKRSPLRVFAAACIIAAGFCFVAGIYIVGLTDKDAAARDFIGYWAAGQQLIHGADPYDVAATLRLEQAAGLDDTRPRVTPSPPVALLLVLPLGLFGAKNGLIFWLLAQLACLSISIWVLWLLNGRPLSRFHLFGYFFAPALSCLMAGQLGIFLLLGIVLFFYFHESHPFWAGASLLPCALKPHLLLPFGLVLLLWIVGRKAYGIIGGFLAFMAVNCAITIRFDPQIFAQYAQFIHASGIQDRFTPTVSLTLRVLIPPHPVWLQFLPEAAACVWSIWFYLTWRNRWRWTEQGMLLLVVSMLCAPYAWFPDEAIVLPAVLSGLYRAAELHRSLLPIGLIGGVALIEVAAKVQITSNFFLWTAPTWLAWYLYATWKRGPQIESAR
jgi:Glycosyltransferase family 87